MFCLREDACPGVEQGRGIVDRFGNSLCCKKRLVSAWMHTKYPVVQHTPMFPLALSKVPMTPSITSLIFLTPSRSLRRAASRDSSVSNREFWLVGVLDRPGAGLGGDAKVPS